jgi:hypothetical protein
MNRATEAQICSYVQLWVENGAFILLPFILPPLTLGLIMECTFAFRDEQRRVDDVRCRSEVDTRRNALPFEISNNVVAII